MVAAAHTTHAPVTVGQCQLRCGEALPAIEGVLGVGLVYACYELVLFLIVRVDGDAVGTGPAEHGADGAALVLAGLSVERNHDVGTVVYGVLSAAHLVYFEHSGLQWFFVYVCLGSPCAVLMAHPRIALS